MDWFKIHCCGVVRQYYKNVVTLHIFLDIALYLPPYCNKLFDPNLTHEHPDKAFYLKKKWVFPHCSTNWPIRPNLIVRLIPLFPFYRLDSTLSWSFSFANEYSVWVDWWGGGVEQCGRSSHYVICIQHKQSNGGCQGDGILPLWLFFLSDWGNHGVGFCVALSLISRFQIWKFWFLQSTDVTFLDQLRLLGTPAE